MEKCVYNGNKYTIKEKKCVYIFFTIKGNICSQNSRK